MAPLTIAVLNGTSRVNQHIIEQALAQGQRVRAIVRSTSRFYTQAKKHVDLEAHEWSDFSDLTPLTSILEGVDVLYIALSALTSKLHEPTWINLNAVTSVCTVLRDRVAPGKRCATKIVLLAAFSTIPNGPRPLIVEKALGNQYNDLRAAQDFLLKQRGWLDATYIVPGIILNSESSADEACSAAVKLREGTASSTHPEPISYARLAAAMQLAATDSQWTGKFAIPTPTTKVTKSIRHYSVAAEVMLEAVKHQLIFPLGKALVFAMIGGAAGYVMGSRSLGPWSPQMIGTYGKNIW